jgi:monoamine oxidase
MIKPVPNIPVYVCGEAYSNGQGWVEGALETAELVLQGPFGLSAPAWLAA